MKELTVLAAFAFGALIRLAQLLLRDRSLKDEQSSGKPLSRAEQKARDRWFKDEDDADPF